MIYIENLIKSINSESLIVFFLSMFPLTELRGSIPYGIIFLELHWFKIVLLSAIGNISIGIIVIYLLGPIMNLLMKNKYFNKWISYIFEKTKKKGSVIKNKNFYGLILFVGIPLPLTGVWTGSLAAYLFGFNKIYSIIAIIFGVMVSSTIVTILSLLGYFTIT